MFFDLFKPAKQLLTIKNTCIQPQYFIFIYVENCIKIFAAFLRISNASIIIIHF